ncbi:MAG: ethanolamine ammonia-lyase subunit EutB [Myxococcales bacterium]
MKSANQNIVRASKARPPLARVRLGRRTFLAAVLSASVVRCRSDNKGTTPRGVSIPQVQPGEDIFAYIQRQRGFFDPTLYGQILGAANEYKEGDDALLLAAADETSRSNARLLLSNTKLGQLADRPVLVDPVYTLSLSVLDPAALEPVRAWTMAQLKELLLSRTEDDIKAIMPGLPSDVIGCIVKLMTNDELIAVGQKVFNPLPGSNIGAKGYLGARIQPNSPTDNPEDIVWQVFDGWSFAVGDVVLGTNPVSSEVSSVLAIELALKDLIETFQLQDTIPHCCLGHIDVQAQVEAAHPGSTALWFQSLGGTADANATFDLTVEKMLKHADARTGKYGLYFETGQGADATNGHGAGFDIVLHESRKYGFARALRKRVVDAQVAAGRIAAPWVHLNDVAGFIGPEVFRSKEQLVRCCLEDTVMGKLHGLPIGLDICSTLHMDIGLDDLDACIRQVMPANPAYLMALPTKNDPMLSYLTTAFQDHVRVRHDFGYKVNDAMWAFFKKLGVIDDQGNPTEHFGDPKWVYLQYRRAKGDVRTDSLVLDEGTRALRAIKDRGVWVAEGHGTNPWDLNPELDAVIRSLYEDAKKSIYTVFPDDFATVVAPALRIETLSKDRNDYILHPPSGEQLSAAAVAALERLRDEYGGNYDVQIMISDGLAANALTDTGHLLPYLETLRPALQAAGYRVAPVRVVCVSGRVRAGYHAGEVLFGSLPDRANRRALLHVIGERPGSGHHAFSVYMTAPAVETWGQPGAVDHHLTKVVSGISDTSLEPRLAAEQTVALLKQLFNPLEPAL